MNTIEKPQPYVHETTGDVKVVTRGQARFLPGYKRVHFVKNEAGEAVMRINLKGATVDISEAGERKVVPNVNSQPK